MARSSGHAGAIAWQARWQACSMAACRESVLRADCVRLADTDFSLLVSVSIRKRSGLSVLFSAACQQQVHQAFQV